MDSRQSYCPGEIAKVSANAPQDRTQENLRFCRSQVPRPKRSGNQIPLFAVKLDHIQLDGELNDGFGPAMPEGAIGALHEFTEGHCVSLGQGFRLRGLVDSHGAIIVSEGVGATPLAQRLA
jgi:hypothetical protein